MPHEITFNSILPDLIKLTAVVAAIWFLSWAVTRTITHLAEKDANSQRYELVRRRAGELTDFIRWVTFVGSFIVATLILLHGVGITAFPEISWSIAATWGEKYVIPLLFIVGSALIVLRATYLLVGRLPGLFIPEGIGVTEQAERLKTVKTKARLLRWASTAIIAAITAAMILKQFGFDLTTLLAGGAIFSVAIGFGAQNYVRDLIGGLFLILEDQVRTGDVIKINGTGGQVEAIRLRTITLRGLDGTVHIFPHGSINELANLTKGFSRYVIDVGIAYKESVDDVMALLAQIGSDLQQDPRYSSKILEPLEIMGVDDFADSAVIIKIRIMTVPMEQWVVGRELRRRIKNEFDRLGIELPFPHMSVYVGEASKPFAVTKTGEQE